MLQVYTGTGKGKTTAALGVALRAAGRGLHTTMFSFLKDDPEYGEARAFSQGLLPQFVLKQVGRDAFVNFKNPDPVDVAMCQDGWQQAKQAILEKQADIIILDELNIVLATKLLDENEVVPFLKEHAHDLEIITTGRMAPESLMKAADLVTDMQEVKHYFHKGVASRNGIDH